MTSQIVRMGAIAAMAVSLFSAGAAFAQPKPAPSAPAAPAEAAGPIKLDLIPMEAHWTKVCSKDPTGKDVCFTGRTFGQSAQQPTLSFAVYVIGSDERRFARFLLPVAMLLRPGFRLTIDKSEPVEGHFIICFPTGCVGEAELTSAQLGAMKKGTNAAVITRNQANLEVTFNTPLKDFGASFDGPALDPKVLQQQQEELQKQLEERAREQREQLEKQQGGAQPTPTPSPTKP